jgi:hypothetical protein
MMVSSNVLLSLWLTLSIHWYFPVEAAPMFVRQPSSQNVSEGTTATFNCTGYSQSYEWRINGKLSDHISNEHRGLVTEDRIINAASHLTEHLLHVPAWQINNEISIQCIIYTINVVYGNLYLNIQGALTAVSNVSMSYVNSTTIIVSYTAPPTLVGVLISNYSIYISATNEFHWTETESIQLTLDNPCINYTLEISAWNSAGQGAVYYLPSFVIYKGKN